MVKLTEKARQKFQQGRDKQEISANAMLRINFGGVG